MKKSRKVISTLLVGILLAAVFPAGVRAEQFRSSAKAYALIEVNTGQIIAAENAEVKLHAAGLTKLMSYLLFYEAIGEGKVKPEDSVRVSPGSCRKGRHQRIPGCRGKLFL